MPRVNPEILVWARETAGLSRDEAAARLDIKTIKGASSAERMAALETGKTEPTRSTLVKMAKLYRRPLLTFYLSGVPAKGDRGQDFRTLPDERSGTAEVLLDVLIRDVRARQSIVRSILEEDEDTKPLPFVGSLSMDDGVESVRESIKTTLGFDLGEFRAQQSAENAFRLLRNQVEASGVFVLLIGNLGSHHTTIDLETFRGFALADPIAPFIVINDQDAKSAWSFTLLHELSHLWLGATGVSGAFAEMRIEQFCNDVASTLLLADDELSGLHTDDGSDVDSAIETISEFANQRNLSRSLVSYRLHRAGYISQAKWVALRDAFRNLWLREKMARKERTQETEGGPNYYVVRRHRLGPALLAFADRSLGEGVLTPAKAGRVLGVKPRNVQPLLKETPVGFPRATRSTA